MSYLISKKNTKGLVALVISLFTISLSAERSYMSLSKHFCQLLPMAVGCETGVSPQIVDLLSPKLVGYPWKSSAPDCPYDLLSLILWQLWPVPVLQHTHCHHAEPTSMGRNAALRGGKLRGHCWCSWERGKGPLP